MSNPRLLLTILLRIHIRRVGGGDHIASFER